MLRPEEEVYLTENPCSCSQDEAVAKLLGWMQGNIRLKYIALEKGGVISPDQLEHLHSLESPIVEFIIDQSNALSLVLQDLGEQFSAATDEAEKVRLCELIGEKDEAVGIWRTYAEQARGYLSDINNELNKGDQSEIKLDLIHTDQLGKSYIVVRSLEQWAEIKYHNKPGLNNYQHQKTTEAIVLDTQPIATEYLTVEAMRADRLRREILHFLANNQKATAAIVMDFLKSKAGANGSCVLSDVGNGIKWEDDNGTPKILTMRALRERLRLIDTLSAEDIQKYIINTD